MLLQTNSYIVPKTKRADHARLMGRFRRCFARLGSAFEVYEQVGPGFAGDGGGRFVQIMRFRDRKHHAEVQTAERDDPAAQTLIADFCRLVNLPYQQQQGLFAMSYYGGVLTERGGDEGDLAVDEPAVTAGGEDDDNALADLLDRPATHAGNGEHYEPEAEEEPIVSMDDEDEEELLLEDDDLSLGRARG